MRNGSSAVYVYTYTPFWDQAPLAADIYTPVVIKSILSVCFCFCKFSIALSRAHVRHTCIFRLVHFIPSNQEQPNMDICLHYAYIDAHVKKTELNKISPSE